MILFFTRIFTLYALRSSVILRTDRPTDGLLFLEKPRKTHLTELYENYSTLYNTIQYNGKFALKN